MKSNQVALVESYVQSATDLNGTDADGTTALMWAARLGHDACVALLLDGGANPSFVGVMAHVGDKFAPITSSYGAPCWC